MYSRKGESYKGNATCYSAIKEDTPHLGGGSAAARRIYLSACIPRSHDVLAALRVRFAFLPVDVPLSLGVVAGALVRRYVAASLRETTYIYTCPLLFVASRFVELRQAGDVPRRANMAHSLSIHRYVRSKHLYIMYVRTEMRNAKRVFVSRVRRFLRIRKFASFYFD